MKLSDGIAVPPDPPEPANSALGRLPDRFDPLGNVHAGPATGSSARAPRGTTRSDGHLWPARQVPAWATAGA
ncbi:hypothetical protein BRC93_02430 [Halobacteriales archaeon QS_5_70_15]|nr:MAG: hypothetical protein BRC93_02430 [Halobacteriales archaeon QS_5_70_15]